MNFAVAGLCFTDAAGVAMHHDLRLVALSFVIAVGGSFTALEMIERWRNARGAAARYWQFGSATVFGGTVWSMHFVGMLALREHFAISYAPGTTVLSLLIAIAAVGLGLEIVRDAATWLRVAGAGLTVGLGVGTMHYVGMAGLRFAGSLAYTPTLWGVSLLVGIAAATCALWLALTLQVRWQRGCAAIVMGSAICAMHYVGMAAAVFQIDLGAPVPRGLPNELVAVMVAVLTLAVTLCALVMVAVDRRLLAFELREAAALRSSALELVAINVELELGRSELDRKSRLFEVTLQHLAQGIVMTDANDVVQVINRRMGELFDLPASVGTDQPNQREVIRMLWRRGEYGTEYSDFDAWFDSFKQAGGLSSHYIHRRPDGRILESKSIPMPDGGSLLTFTDMTEQKQAEEAMRTARDQADRAARAKSEFLAMMSHEIRSPMSGLIGVLDLLREAGLAPDHARMVDLARGSAEVLLAVLNDILDFSKIEAKAIAVVPEPTRIKDLVSRVVQPHTLDAARKGNELKTRYGSEFPEWVAIDPLRLTQILNNLLSNAVKFTTAGEIELTVEIVGDDPDRRLCLAVRDSGIGMSTATIAALFEPFVQADASTTRIYGGTGLGLCISKRLARLMGGNLTVASSKGAGSIFTLLLPFTAASMPGAAGAGTTALPFEIPVGCLRVLVVDDDLTNRWISQRSLELLGLRVDTAEDGETALKMLRERKYDLVLTDCHMPRMDGVALTKAVRAAPEAALNRLPIIGLTADVTSGQHERCLAAGMSEVAIKPLSRLQLSQLLAFHLSGVTPAAAAANDGPREQPAFDDTTYRELFVAGEPDGEACLAEFRTTAENLCIELKALLAIEVGTPVRRDELVAIAHRLAGTALSIGAMRLGAAARALEQAAPNGGIEKLRARCAVVHDEFAAAETATSAFIAGWRLEAA